MSIPSKAPLRMAGAIVNALFPNTGEVRMTRGGDQAFSSISGIGADAQIWSGTGGRLNSATRYTYASGNGVYFYDAVTVTSGGPFVASGHKILGALLQPIPTFAAAISGASLAAWTTPGIPLAIDAPFSSGLCVAIIGGSGSIAFGCTFTPETSPGVSGLAT